MMTNKNLEREASKRVNSNNLTTIALANISDNHIRNLVRGALASNDNRAFSATMSRIHRECNSDDAEAVGQILRTKLTNNINIDDAFLQSAEPLAEIPFYAASRLDIEISIHCERLNRNCTQVVEAIILVEKINSALLDNDTDNVEHLFRSYRERFGVSRMVALKAISARNSGNTQTQKLVDDTSVLEPYLSPKREVAIAAFENITNPNRDYIEGRRFFVNLARNERLLPRDKALVFDLISPLSSSSSTNAERLQVYGQGGIIDLIAFLFRTMVILRSKGMMNEVSLIENAIPAKITEAWKTSFSDLSISRLQNFIGREDQFFDMKLFSHIPAWSEYEVLLEHRINIEAAFSRRIDGTFNDLRSEATELILARTNSNEIVGKNLTPVAGKDWPVPIGGFARTLTLLASIEKSTLLTPKGEELSQLLDQTINVSKLLTVSEIEKFLPVNKEDMLYEYLKAALLNDLESGSTRNHALRRALEVLISNQFDGSILALIHHLDTDNGHTAQHLFNLCSEAFLTTLYGLYKRADDIVEAQTSLLEWQGNRMNDEAVKLKAKSLRLLIRLRKVRGSIEKTRLYVDPLRFFEWVHETMEDDIRQLIPLADEIINAQELTYNPKDALNNNLQPRSMLLDVVDRSYEEFCTNNVYGASSYIARRIRHGTFHGQLSLEMQPQIKSSINKFEEIAPDFTRYLKDWNAKFDDAVIAFARDQLHIRSKAKPNGLIVASLADNDKSNIINPFIKNIASELSKKQETSLVVATIFDFCWTLIEIDLDRARQAIEHLRREFVIEVDNHLCGLSELDSEITDCVRELNLSLSQRFATAKSWLTRPENFSPRASVSLMIEAVLDEVKKRYNFFYKIDLPSEQDIDLIGHRFHSFYDALYILIGNAAKYGLSDKPLFISVRTRRESNAKYIDMEVKVTSSIHKEHKEQNISSIETAMTADIGDAMQRDRRSGLQKLRHLVEETDEMLDIKTNHDDECIHFILNFRYLLSK